MRWLSTCIACVALATLSGCSALVSGDGSIRCDPAAVPDPCPSGMRCQAVAGVSVGVCGDQESCASDRDHDGFNRCDVDGRTLDCNDADPQVFPGAPEQCNGIDDNCNQNIDEEQEDADGDTYTRCGSPSRAADCDEEDPGRHPGAAEVCDGIDNNCDGNVDEDPGGAGLCGGGAFCVAGRGCVEVGCSASGCPAGSSCDSSLSPPTCVNDSCTTSSCLPGQRCDRDTGACVDEGRPGDACVSGADCQSGVCADSPALRIPGSPPARVCVQACCSDANCGSDEVCWDGGLGARSCLPATLVGTSVGPGRPTSSCTSGSECRSGTCSSGATCLAACTQDAQCGSGVTCAPTLDSGAFEMSCRNVSGGAGSLCGADNDCAVGFCTDIFLGSGVCTGACAAANDCGSLLKCALVTYSYTDGSVGYGYACAPKRTFGSAGQGANCGGNGDCAEERCINGRCVNPCCSPEQCTGGNVCAPVPNGSHWEMRCVPAAG
ncbi:MAG: hypothetical protein GXP55_02140 [Deltaproteobacteria bacterium]|nr:hypothetical protein [Deltaproteobacteria bacterium]